MIYIHYLLGTAPKRDGGLTSKNKPDNIVYCADELPVPAPRWPQERDYGKVRNLITYEDGIDTDFIKTMPKGGTIVEIGFGDGKFMNDMKLGREDIKTVGVTVTSWEVSDAIKSIDEIYVQYVPNDMTLFNKMQNSVDVVVDCFASLTFADNPFHSLIYLTLLLKDGGQLTGVTYLEKEGDYSSFGSPDTIENMLKFFKKHLNTELVFNRRAFTMACATHYALQIQCVRGKSDEILDFQALKTLADETIGVPENIKSYKSIALYSFGSFAICKKDYKVDSSESK